MQAKPNAKVIDLVPVRKNIYKVNIAGTIYELCEETVIKYRLVKGKEVLDVSQILAYDNLYKHYDDIKNYYLRFPKSRYNFAKVVKEKYPDIDIDLIIDRLISQNIINDYKYAYAKAYSLNKKGYGNNYIKNYLAYREHIDQAIITDTLANFTDDLGQLEDLIDKLIVRYSKWDDKVKYQKIVNYLLQKGYKYETFKSILQEKLVK